MSAFGPKHPISETSWRRGAAAAFAVLVVVFGLLLERAEDQTDKVDKRVTKVESPCLKYGADSKQCEKAFEAAVSTITHPQACAIERKAGTLQAIRELAAELDVAFAEPCAGARIAQERERGNERAASQELQADTKPAQNLDDGSGGAPAPGNPADSDQPDPANPDGPRQQQPPKAGDGGSGDGQAPADPGSEQPSPTTRPFSGPPADTPGKGPLPQTAEAVGGAAEKAAGALDEALCAARGLLAPCTP